MAYSRSMASFTALRNAFPHTEGADYTARSGACSVKKHLRAAAPLGGPALGLGLSQALFYTPGLVGWLIALEATGRSAWCPSRC